MEEVVEVLVVIVLVFTHYSVYFILTYYCIYNYTHILTIYTLIVHFYTLYIDLTLCAICKFRVSHIDSVVKHLPKRDAHVGSVEHMLNKSEKTPMIHARSTVF